VGLPFRGILASWKTGLTGAVSVFELLEKSHTRDRVTPCYSTGCDWQAKEQLAQKELEVSTDKLSRSLQHASASRKAKHVPSCMGKSVASS